MYTVGLGPDGVVLSLALADLRFEDFSSELPFLGGTLGLTAKGSSNSPAGVSKSAPSGLHAKRRKKGDTSCPPYKFCVKGLFLVSALSRAGVLLVDAVGTLAVRMAGSGGMGEGERATRARADGPGEGCELETEDLLEGDAVRGGGSMGASSVRSTADADALEADSLRSLSLAFDTLRLLIGRRNSSLAVRARSPGWSVSVSDDSRAEKEGKRRCETSILLFLPTRL